MPSAQAAKSVLGRVDGALDTSDIAALTGLPEQSVEEAVTALMDAGLLSSSSSSSSSVEAWGQAHADGKPAPGIGRVSLVPPGLPEVLVPEMLVLDQQPGQESRTS